MKSNWSPIFLKILGQFFTVRYNFPTTVANGIFGSIKLTKRYEKIHRSLLQIRPNSGSGRQLEIDRQTKCIHSLWQTARQTGRAKIKPTTTSRNRTCPRLIAELTAGFISEIVMVKQVWAFAKGVSRN